MGCRLEVGSIGVGGEVRRECGCWFWVEEEGLMAGQ